MARRARTDESRVDQSRAAEKRPALKSRFALSLSIPPEVIKDAKARGVRLHWMNRAVLGDEGAASVQLGQRMMRGWTPVPASRYQDMAAPPLPGRPALELIERGGMILMEKNLKDWQADREELRVENMNNVQRIKWIDGAQNADPRMPFTQDANDVSIMRQAPRPGAKFQDDE